MNSDKLSKQIWAVCILLFVCVIINFVFSFSRGGGDDAKLRKDLNEAYAKISVLEREVAYLNEQAASGDGSGDKSIAYGLLEGRVSILEKSGVGSDASIDRRLAQLEMKVSTLEIAFKQANGITAAAANTNTNTNKQPAATTQSGQNKTSAANTGGSNTKAQQTQTGSSNKTPIQIQTGSATAPSANAKYHTVQAGENLFRISQKYGLTVEQLRRMNNMKENDVLKAGQRLVVSQ